MTRVICDSDIWAYAAGGATQRTLYDWCAVMGGEAVEGGIAENKADLEAARDAFPEGTEFHVTEVVDAEPLEHALALCKRSLLSVEEAMEASGVQFDRMELFLTGKDNFRDRVATIKGYKANRIGKSRPVHYRAIRRYMRERWHATTVHGYEADDALAMVAHQHNYDPEAVILVSQDKDLSTVPGRHYNPRKKTWKIITPQEALLNFYRQVLTGDPVDNIGGCYKCGPKAADELLVGLNDATEEVIAQAILLQYEQSLARKGCPYSGHSEAMLENCRLLHMARSPEETLPSGYWNFPWERA